MNSHEQVAVALDAGHGLVLVHVQPEVLHQLAIVPQPLAPRGLVAGGGERNVGDLQLFRAAEEGGVGGIAVHRPGYRPLVEHRAGKAALLRRDAHRQPARPRPHHQDVERLLLRHRAPSALDTTRPAGTAPSGRDRITRASIAGQEPEREERRSVAREGVSGGNVGHG